MVFLRTWDRIQGPMQESFAALELANLRVRESNLSVYKKLCFAGQNYTILYSDGAYTNEMGNSTVSGVHQPHPCTILKWSTHNNSINREMKEYRNSFFIFRPLQATTSVAIH